MASLAALLLLVAWNMSELRHFIGLLKVAPRSDVFVLLTCLLLTVFFDMVIAVSVGFVLAAILFMRRMAELIFGAAQNAMEALHTSNSDAFHTLILHLGKAPVIDATGFAALESAIEVRVKRKKVVILAGPLPRPRKVFDKARLETHHEGMVHIAEDLAAGLKLAREMRPPPSNHGPPVPPAADAAA